MRFTKEHRIELSASRFIECSFEPEFLKRMNLSAMGVQTFETQSRDVDGDIWTIKNRVTPADNMPGFIKKLVGQSFYYDEVVTHKKGSDTITATMTPSVLRDKFKMSYTLRVHPLGESACRRVMDWDIEIKIFGIGGQVEKFAAGQVESGLEQSASYMSKNPPAAH